MNIMRRMMAAILVLLLLLTVGCSSSSADGDSSAHDTNRGADQGTQQGSDENTEQGTAGASSLNALRQAMVGTSQLFAVAYFGYHETIDSDLPVDPYEAMGTEAPRLCENLPFLLEIPADRVIGGTGDLFCIVPLEEDATVAVSKGTWDISNEQYLYEESLYYSESGEPILVFCNNAGWEPDTQLSISGSFGEVVWYPQADDNHCAAPLRNNDWEVLFYDFSPYREMLMKDYADMKGEWVMPTEEMLQNTYWAWEGYRKDGLETSYQLFFHDDTLSIQWNDGIDAEDHLYLNAPWVLTYEEDYAVLSIDFGEFAGVLRYNLLYHEDYEQLYFGMDVVLEGMPVGWEPLHRFLTAPWTPDSSDMAGVWELVWTEVEGDCNAADPEAKIIEITTDYEGLFWISYTDNEFPRWSFYDKELIVFPFEMYQDCFNDEWSAAVNYTGINGTEYTVTAVDGNTLLMQHYWTVDGAPAVGYEWYRKVR